MLTSLPSSQASEFPSRVSFVHNPAVGPADSTIHPQVSSLFAQLIMKGLLERVSPGRLLEILGAGDVASPDHTRQVVIAAESGLDEILERTELKDEEYQEYAKASRLVARALGFVPGEQGLLVNGRVCCPFWSQAIG